MNKRGKQQQHTTRTIERVLEHVRQGQSAQAAARIYGVPVGTADSWVRQHGGVAKIRRKRKPVRIGR